MISIKKKNKTFYLKIVTKDGQIINYKTNADELLDLLNDLIAKLNLV